ncbi:MAG: hypothetical protein IKL85_00210, partial [Lentisphaeria bacterium]|nr:hypothetical protein [Lentisphaeria bacterium]
ADGSRIRQPFFLPSEIIVCHTWKPKTPEPRIFRKLKILILSDYFSFFLFFELAFSAKMQYNILGRASNTCAHRKS